MTTNDPGRANEERVHTRRAFAASVLRTAVYVAPAVYVLQRPAAGQTGPSCKPIGSACIDHFECCTNCCQLSSLTCMSMMQC